MADPFMNPGATHAQRTGFLDLHRASRSALMALITLARSTGFEMGLAIHRQGRIVADYGNIQDIPSILFHWHPTGDKTKA